MVTATCVATGLTAKASLTGKGNVRLPKGWKRINEKDYSPSGWKSLFRLSAVIVPIVGLHQNEEGLSEEAIKSQRREGWQRLNAALKESWAHSTAIANWAVQELMRHDTFRMPGAKLPKMKPVYLYGSARDEFDLTGWATTANAVMRTVEQTYRSYRSEMLGYGRRSLPDIRYPYPWLVPSQNWSLEIVDGRAVVSLGLKGVRVQVALSGGHRYRRQITGLKQIVAGTALPGEASIYRRGSDILLKIVGYFPRKTDDRERSGTLLVRTAIESFIVALNEAEEKLFIVNGDRMRRETAKHAWWQQREREDQKFETRRPHRQRKSRGQRMSEGAEKHRHRLDSFIKETANQLANYAARRGLATLKLDDKERGFFGERFPYHALKLRLAQKCDELGLQFECFDPTEMAGSPRNDATGE